MDGKKCPIGDSDDIDKFWGVNDPRDTRIQIVLSFALGLTAFVTFCVGLPMFTFSRALSNCFFSYFDRDGRASMRRARSRTT